MRALLITIVIGLAPPASAQESWPQFRGPSGQGIAGDQQLPPQLKADEAVWRQEIEGLGWSSPVVSGGRVFLTTAVEQPDESQVLKLLAVDAASGGLLFSKTVFTHEPARKHGKNSHASPTPVVDRGRVYVHFGPHGTACLDTDGNVIWKQDDLEYPPVHGNGGSPVLAGGHLIFSADGASDPFIVALSAEDGSVAWRTARPTRATKKFSFSTPLVVEADGGQQVLSTGSDMLSALDVATGEKIWHVDYQGYSVIPRPVAADGMVFFSTSYDSATAMAVRLGGRGDVTDTHVAWTEDKAAPHTPSMIVSDGLLFMVSDRGIASCLDAQTGKTHWRERLDGNYSASPVLAGGRLHFFSEQGNYSVVAAGREFRLLGGSDLQERTLASPAVVGAALLVRTEKHLYRFQ